MIVFFEGNQEEIYAIKVSTPLSKEDTNKLDLLYKIVSYSGNVDTILKYSEQAIKLAEKLNISPAQPTVYEGVGYLNSGILAPALECFM